jgi:hypothetical protein
MEFKVSRPNLCAHADIAGSGDALVLPSFDANLEWTFGKQQI